jgi:hypothetical protein
MKHEHLWAKLMSHYAYLETMMQHSAELPLQSSVFAVFGTEMRDTVRYNTLGESLWVRESHTPSLSGKF